MKKKRLLPFSIALSAVAITAFSVPVFAESSLTIIDDMSIEESVEAPEDYFYDGEAVIEEERVNIEDVEAVEVEERFEENVDESVVIDDVEKIVLPRLEREGYTQKCWSNTPDGSGEIYNIGDEYVVGTDEDLYAIWVENEVKCTLDATLYSEKNSVQELVLSNEAEQNTFEDEVFIGKVDTFNVSAAAIGLTAEFGNVEDFDDVEIAVYSYKGGMMVDEVITPTSSKATVTYSIKALKDDEVIATSSVSVVFDFTEEIAEEEPKATEEAPAADEATTAEKATAEDAKEAEPAKEAEKAEEVYSFIPAFKGIDAKMKNIVVTELVDPSDIAPAVNGAEFEYAEVNGVKVFMLDKNAYYDKDWRKIDKDTVITFVYATAAEEAEEAEEAE